MLLATERAGLLRERKALPLRLHAPEWVVQTLLVLVALGFPIALVLAWALEATPEGIKRTGTADAMPIAPGQKKHAWIYIVVIGGATSVALFFLGRYTAQNTLTRRPAAEELRHDRQSEAATAASATSQKSIAVLPLLNESGDPGDEYFSDGLSEELIEALAQIKELKVIGRSSSFRFKQTRQSSADCRRVD